MKNTLFLAALLACTACSQDWHDSSLPPQRRAELLVREMTLEEKVGQLECPYGWEMYERRGDSAVLTERFQKMIDEQHIGMLWGTFRADPWTKRDLKTGLSPAMAAELANTLQRYAIEHSRLGIPVFLAEEAPHGFMSIGATVFPTALGQASTWNPALIEQMGAVVASELRSQGGHIAYGPVLDIAREPRWSRVEECYGEDPCLTGAMGAAFVTGLGSADLTQADHAVSTVKHVAAYGISEGGQNGGSALIGERELRRTHLPAVRRAVESGARSIMTAYSSIDGIPCTANSHLLQDVLRHEWGFTGFVVSDLFSIEGLYETHHLVASVPEAAITALTAGVDVDLCGQAYATLIESVRSGKIAESAVDRATERVLRLKFEMGLFENPYVDPATCTAGVDAHRQTALDVARQSVILLENKGILPLSKSLKTVAVIGPNADNVYNQLGDYTAQQSDAVVTLRRGVEQLIGAEKVRYVKGCAIRDLDSSEIGAAAVAARGADVAVVVVGGSSARDFDTEYLATGAAVASTQVLKDMECGEGNDRQTLSLLGRQQALLEAVKATGTPLVVVYIEGRPLDMNWAAAEADALLLAWYPGQAGGTALAEVLFGDYNPAGRLPLSVPRSVGQLPVHYNKLAPANHDYADGTAKPLYAFGYGLSYARFDYSDLRVEPIADGAYRITCRVANPSERDGDEVAQLYIRHCTASVVQPLLELRAFERVAVAAGAEQTIEFTLTRDDLSILGRQMRPVVEPGNVEVMIGAASDDIRLTQTIAIP